jgi:ketosteroid isomerase-like protein
MLKRSLLILAIILTASAVGLTPDSRGAQFPQQPPPQQPPPRPQQPPPGMPPGQMPPATTPAPRRPVVSARARAAAAEAAVREAFDTLVEGIRRADVEAVMSVYWKSPQLVLFNNNGTVTKTWEQVRTNRASSYPNLKDVKLDVRDVRVKLLGTDAALVTCLWTQSQTVRDQQETATGRLSLVFQKIGGEWKIVHTHTSPDRPDPSLILPSERTTEPAPQPTDKPESKPPAESKPAVKP